MVKKLDEDKIESSIRGLIDAFEKKDGDKLLSFFADDAVWHAPEGEFKGKVELARYIAWQTSARFGDVKFEDTGIGIVVKGNKAVYEYIYEATIEGTRYRIPGVCLYQFSDGKCVYHRSIMDRLSAAVQGATGFIGKRAVNAVVDQVETGLH
jgi:ketosteroid isomerase-like protein